MSFIHWNSGLETPIVVPAPGSGDPDWFEVTIDPHDYDADAVISVGVDFVWGGTSHDYSSVLRNAPIEGGDGSLLWQVIFRRPSSGSYSVRLYGVLGVKDEI